MGVPQSGVLWTPKLKSLSFGHRNQSPFPLDTEIKVPFVVNPELTSVLPLKPGAGQNIATWCDSRTQGTP